MQTTDNFSGGYLRLRLTPELADAFGRQAGYWRIRLSSELKGAIVDACERAGARPKLGTMAVFLLERALSTGRLIPSSLPRPAGRARAALAEELSLDQLEP